jgi:hypothetical protein
MGMRVVGIPVVNGHPVQPGFQVGGHALHELARVTAKVFQFPGILHRNDEAELVPVALTAFLEGLEVDRVGLRSIGLAGLSVVSRHRSM